VVHAFARILFLLFTLAAAWTCAGEDFVTKDEFEKFRAEFEKYKAENEKLKVQHAQLTKAIENVQASIKRAPIDSRLSTYMSPQPGITREELDAVRSGTTKFLISGWADAGYEDRKGANSTFTASFHPVFLWKINDQISFESDFEYVTLAYHFHDLLTLEAGRFITPLGSFVRNQRPSWINKLPDRPFVFDPADGLVPTISVGANLGGGFNAGPTKFNWNAYVANGPSLNTFSAGKFGALEFSRAIDNNRNKAFGGRLGFFPIPELELGGSFMSARVGSKRTLQSDTDALIYAADAAYNNVFDAIKGTIDLRAEWVWSNVDDARYEIGGDEIAFNNNRRNGGYVQAAYRPSKIQHKWVKNLEVAFRYDRIDQPAFHADAPDEARSQRVDRDRWSGGLNYWLGHSTVLKFAYEWDTRDQDALLFQFAIGF